MCYCQTQDFTTLHSHQAKALKEWFEGRAFNPQHIAEAFVRLGIKADPPKGLSKVGEQVPANTCEGYKAAPSRLDVWDF